MGARLPARIVVFCLPGIGDALMFTPALGVLRRALPAAHITAVTMFRGTAQVLETNPDVDEVRVVDLFAAGLGRRLREVWALRGGRFDLALLPFPTNRLGYNLLNRAVGRQWRAGHRYGVQSWRNLWFLNDVVVRETGIRHNVDENVALVQALCAVLGVAASDPAPRLALHLTPDDQRQADAFLRARGLAANTPLVGVHTFSSTFKNMHRKCWDQEAFGELVQRLDEVLPGARALVFSGPDDRAAATQVLRHAGARAALVDLPNLRWSAALLARCRLLVSNDSALMHVAAALAVPVVALFGPTDWRRLHPWGVPHRIVRRDLPCMPCFQYSSRPLHCAANLDYACMRGIAVDEVLAAMRDFTGARGA